MYGRPSEWTVGLEQQGRRRRSALNGHWPHQRCDHLGDGGALAQPHRDQREIDEEAGVGDNLGEA